MLNKIKHLCYQIFIHYYGALTFSLIALDIITKVVMEKILTSTSSITLIPHLLEFTLVYNQGAFGGMLGFQAGHIILIIISILGTLLLGYALYKFRNSMNKWELLGIVLALAGCVGNLIDRVIYIDGQPRGVIDFIHFYIEKINFDWPVFNVADMLLVVGIILFAIFYLVEESKKEKQKKQALELLEKQKKEELNQGDENGK